MFDDTAFLRENVVDVDAAVVGISRRRWVDIAGPAPTEYEALDIMRRHRFDVLPIVESLEVIAYFETNTWGVYTSATRKSVSQADLIPFDVSISEVIRRLAIESRLFFFLCSHDNTPVGLISVVNLNCRQVQVYLFSLLCELERRLADFITRSGIPDSELSAIFFSEAIRPKHRDLKTRYDNDRRNSLELPIVEYLYLSDLVKIVRTKRLYTRLGFPSGGTFEDAFGRLVKLRDSVAHPVTSLITEAGSVKRLWSALNQILTVLPGLREA